MKEIIRESVRSEIARQVTQQNESIVAAGIIGVTAIVALVHSARNRLREIAKNKIMKREFDKLLPDFDGTTKRIERQIKYTSSAKDVVEVEKAVNTLMKNIDKAIAGVGKITIDEKELKSFKGGLYGAVFTVDAVKEKVRKEFLDILTFQKRKFEEVVQQAYRIADGEEAF